MARGQLVRQAFRTKDRYKNLYSNCEEDTRILRFFRVEFYAPLLQPRFYANGDYIVKSEQRVMISMCGEYINDDSEVIGDWEFRYIGIIYVVGKEGVRKHKLQLPLQEQGR